MPCAEQTRFRDSRSMRYLQGVGIELGALNNPLNVPKNATVMYVDRLTYEELIKHYPEFSDTSVVKPDIIDDAGTLSKINNETFDFCIANHVLEHLRDLIGALLTWIRVLKPRGILFLAVPDKTNLLDSGRKLNRVGSSYPRPSKNG